MILEIANCHFGVHDSTARSILLHIELGVEGLLQKTRSV